MLRKFKKIELLYLEFLLTVIQSTITGLIVGFISTYQGEFIKQFKLDMNTPMIYSTIIGLLIFINKIRSLDLLTSYRYLIYIHATYGVIILLWFYNIDMFMTLMMLFSPIWMLLNSLFRNRLNKVISENYSFALVDFGDAITAYSNTASIMAFVTVLLIGTADAFKIAVLLAIVSLYLEIKRYNVLKRI
jgi:hypothetical protein